MKRWPDKDREPYLSRTNDKILTSDWIVPDGITKSHSVWDDYVTTVWLAGGSAGHSYKITNRVITMQGRTLDQSVQIHVKEL